MANSPHPTRRAILAGLTALAVPAPAAAATTPSPGSDICHSPPLAGLPVVLAGGLVLVPGGIDGHYVELVLDTGAERTALDPRIATALRLPRLPVPAGMAISGAAGATPIEGLALVRDFSFGGEVRHDLRPPLVRLPEGIPGHPPAGLLGADVLGRFGLDLDIAARRLLVYPSGVCGGRPPGWRHGWHLPAFRQGQLLLLPVILDGVRLTAALDSGASGSVVLAQAARKLGLTHADLSHDSRHLPGHAAGGANITLYPHRFRHLRIGDYVRNGPVMAVSSRDIGGIDMLVGLDLFNRARIWIDQAAASVYIWK